MEDTGHQCRHTEKREVLVRHRHAEIGHIAQACKKETCDASQEKAWCKYTTTTATAIRDRRSYSLEYYDKEHEQQQHASVSIEKRVFHYHVLGRAIDKLRNGFISLAIERRKKEYEHAEHTTADKQFVIWVLQFLELFFYSGCHMGKVERNQTTHNTQYYYIRYARKVERILHMELESCLGAHEQV